MLLLVSSRIRDDGHSSSRRSPDVRQLENPASRVGVLTDAPAESQTKSTRRWVRWVRVEIENRD